MSMMQTDLIRVLGENGMEREADFHLALDVSGGMQEVVLTRFLESVAVASRHIKPSAIVLYQFDTEVLSQLRYETFDPRLVKLFGGGGTKLSPVFKAARAEFATRLTILTDGQFAVPSDWIAAARGLDVTFLLPTVCGASAREVQDLSVIGRTILI